MNTKTNKNYTKQNTQNLNETSRIESLSWSHNAFTVTESQFGLAITGPLIAVVLGWSWWPRVIGEVSSPNLTPLVWWNRCILVSVFWSSRPEPRYLSWWRILHLKTTRVNGCLKYTHTQKNYKSKIIFRNKMILYTWI